MNQAIVQSSGGITLVGGAPVSAALFRIAQQRAPVIVAADGGANRCLSQGIAPAAVIGDMDSISPAARAAVPSERFHHIPEQDTTDFDKALRSVDAPFVIAIGFVGARVDHGLAVLTTLVRQQRPCVLLGPQDVVFHAPPRLQLDLRRKDRFSLYPLARISGRSTGLDWPIDGLDLAPDTRVGTSNRVSTGRVTLELSGPGMLCILPRARLDQALSALMAAARAESRSL
ncbi:thiamine diphosphokinase [Pseudotabrizicola algicola]|uniref:Thiamine diphosphokinase n=1 Tax=Pseudotabrizicola algicola TaxID=2709381 RepID=A0A6B3RRU3_9RHOB|nr:thiamine diphosphokinase [Pseudotabrizicola algicola]NEX45829.1 thiamine diphosphokinase [Pseudotabrizicola algicola]